MNDATEDFKSRLIAVIADFTFKGNDENVKLGRLVYASVGDAIAQYEKEKSSDRSAWLFDGFVSPSAALNEIKSKKRPKNHNSLKAQVERKINDVGDIIKKHKFKNKEGGKNRGTDWNAVSDDVYNNLDIKMPNETKATGKSIQDAYNHALADKKKVEKA